MNTYNLEPEHDHLMIELLRPITLYAQNHLPQYFNQGVLLRVVMCAPHALLVENDQHTSFMVSLSDENRIWRQF